MGLWKTEPAGGTRAVDSLRFEETLLQELDFIHISGDVYAIVYGGPGVDGWLKTVTINSDGVIGGVVDSYEYDTVLGGEPSIINVSGNIFAIVYVAQSFVIGPFPGRVVTVTIADDGTITPAIIDSLYFETVLCGDPDIIHVSGDVYAIAYYRGPDDEDGWLRTITIDSAGNIGAAVIDSLKFEDVRCWEVEIIHVSGTTYAIGYTGPGFDGWLITVSIDDLGNIGAAPIDSFEFDPTAGRSVKILHVSGDVFAIAYQGSDRKLLITLSIDATGTIGAIIDSSPFDDSEYGYIDICLPGARCAITYGHYDGTTYLGWFATIGVESNGQIGTVGDSFNFSTSAIYNGIIQVSEGVFAIAYKDPSAGGSVTTVDTTKIRYCFDLKGLSIPYEDKDRIKKLHVVLQNLSPTAKSAGAAGELVIDIGYEPAA